MRDSVTNSHFTRILDLEQELEKVRDELDAERAIRRESEPHYMVQSLQRQVGTIDFVQDLVQSSEDAQDALESILADTRTCLEEEQIAQTQARDELDLLYAYIQSLIDSTTGRPHDIVRLWRAMEDRLDALIKTRAEIEALHLWVSILQVENKAMQTEMDCM